MQCKWEQVFGKALLSAVAILGLSTNLCAYDGTMKKQAYTPRGQTPNNYAFSYPKDLNLNDPYDGFFHAEALIFQRMETGTSFALENEGVTVPGPIVTDGEIQGFSSDGNWDYNVGLRLGAGMYLNHDAWNLDVTWTWINTTDSEDFSEEDDVFIPLFAAGADTPANASGSGVRGNLQSQINVLDATLGKAYHVSRKVVFNPHFGLRFAWVNQDFSAHYRGFGIVTDPANIFHGDNDFWGVGARMGMDTDWCLGSGFKFFANVSASVLSGKFKIDQSYIAPTPSTISYDIDDNFHMNVPNLELALGLDWGTYLCDHKYYLDFRAGYEFQVWWDQFNCRKVFAGASSGNYANEAVHGTLTLNGFTFRMQLDI